MQDRIKTEAIASYPNEAVWLVTKQGCRQVDNIHSDPKNFFEVSAKDTLQAKKEGLLAVVHSHCDRAPVPSQQDMAGQMVTNVPWGVLMTDGTNATDITWWGEETIPPLEGRKFIHGVSDCYSLGRDYYRLHHDHDIGEVPRNWQWWDEGVDLIGHLAEERGFIDVSLSDIQEGDALLISIGHNFAHHCAIYLGNDLMIHHPGAYKPMDASKLSIIEPVYRYLQYVVGVKRLVVKK